MNPRAYSTAALRLSLCRYFPSDPAVIPMIAEMLKEMVPSREALDWLVNTMVNEVGEWQGPVELRGILCTRYKPLDGREAESSHCRFSPAANEARYLTEHAQLKAGSAPLELLGEIMQPEEPEAEIIERPKRKQPTTRELEQQLARDAAAAKRLTPEQIESRKQEILMKLSLEAQP